MDKGLVHLYWGNGKGKTTAAMGLAVRALGRGLKVSIVQFLKSGDSGELEPLRQLGADIWSGKACSRFFRDMTPEEREATRQLHNEHLRQALESGCDLLILDEACAAAALGMVDESLLRQAVLERPEGREVVLTGRDPAPWMREAADYSTEMHCHKHPYEQGIMARKGVEY
ncbi:MAG: cob(I)yrinic acid a,c-diamide adenosyltransferase [Oscillospiraceae bacterium]|nr:cob(I)yrinic acid a,c-diamide adenosyltransferase [Oscillospiraceae bacterium]